MKVDPHQTIAGQPIRKIRDLLFSLARRTFSIERVRDRIGVGVADQLLSDGLIEPLGAMPSADGDEFENYRVSAAGMRLAMARLNRRIRRRTAERMVAEFLTRVAAVNADQEMLLTVAEVDVFGSFITDAPTLGDIDLATRFEPKSFPGLDWADLNFARAEASGRSLSLLQRRYFGQYQILRRLQNHNNYLALHDVGDLVKLGCDYRRIYPPSEPAVAPSGPTPDKSAGACVEGLSPRSSNPSLPDESSGRKWRRSPKEVGIRRRHKRSRAGFQRRESLTAAALCRLRPPDDHRRGRRLQFRQA
jgi:predicted nucleotidyltransferase